MNAKTTKPPQKQPASSTDEPYDVDDEIQRMQDAILNPTQWNNAICILPLPCKVTLAEDIEATAVAAMIEEGHKVSYKCVWWDKNNRKCEWLESCEVSANDDGKPMQKIGFGA